MFDIYRTSTTHTYRMSRRTRYTEKIQAVVDGYNMHADASTMWREDKESREWESENIGNSKIDLLCKSGLDHTRLYRGLEEQGYTHCNTRINVAPVQDSEFGGDVMRVSINARSVVQRPSTLRIILTEWTSATVPTIAVIVLVFGCMGLLYSAFASMSQS